MATVGYATLDVIPSLKGAQASLQKQAAAPMAAAGRTSGQQFGSSAGAAAGSTFKSRFQAGIKGIAAPLAAVFAGGAALSFFKTGLDDARAYQRAIDGARQIIESTGGTARVTTAHIERMSGALEAQTAVDDEVIARSAALVLTFKNVANAGEGTAAIFDRTLAASLDLAAAGFGDAEGQAKTLAKALNDPIKGLNMLSRSGVTFTQQQQDQIKALAESGDLLSAQKQILAEVESQVKGTAAAQVTGADRAAVAFDNLRQQVGTGLVPAFNSLGDVMADHVIPALSGLVSLTGDAVGVWKDLPGPVKTAAGAFAALRIASLIGLTDGLRGGVSKLSGAMDTLRLRSMLTADAFNAQRANGGRLSATFSGIKAGASGAAAAMKGFMAAAIPVAALTAGITLFAKFRQSQEEARQRVDELTSSLDEQTGALTDNSRELIFKTLQDSGAIDAARTLGISFDVVRRAAEGNSGAMVVLNRELDNVDLFASKASESAGGLGVSVDEATQSVGTLRSAVLGQNQELDKARQAFQDQTDFMGDATDASDELTESTKRHKSEVQRLEGALRKLREAEEQRRLDAIQEQRDQIALIETLRAAEKEARDGKQTLDKQTAAGRENLGALLDLADQWNQSAPKVRQAKGAYENLRNEFIDLADQMNGPNGTRKDAIKLADALLTMPKNVPIKFRSEGFQERMRELRELKEAAKDLEAMLDYNAAARAAGYGATGAPSSGDPSTSRDRRRAVGGF